MKSTNQNTTNLEQTQEHAQSALMEFNEVVVYNEMADHTSVRLNLLEQINSQLGQLETMIQRREFVMKEIFQHIAN